MSAGRATRVATFCLLLIAGLVALLFAMRLTAAMFACSFSPFSYLRVSDDHAVLAWLLVGAFIFLAALVGLVLRHGDDMLWLPGQDGGVLQAAGTLQDAAEAAARGSHPDVLRADAAFSARRSVLGGRLHVRVRPLADVGLVSVAVEEAVRRKVAARTGRDLDTLAVRVRAVTVPQLKRHLP